MSFTAPVSDQRLTLNAVVGIGELEGGPDAEMVDAVLKDKHKILPCCCYLEGEFGVKDLYVGVPAQLGAKGVEKIWEIQLTDSERASLHKSAAAVKELVDVLKI